MNDLMLFDIISVSLIVYLDLVLVDNVIGLLLILTEISHLLEILEFVLLVATLIFLPLLLRVKTILYVSIVLIILVVLVLDLVEFPLILSLFNVTLT